MAVRGWDVICDANTRHFEFPTDNTFHICLAYSFDVITWHSN